jgi:hypothetical protein
LEKKVKKIGGQLHFLNSLLEFFLKRMQRIAVINELAATANTLTDMDSVFV